MDFLLFQSSDICILSKSFDFNNLILVAQITCSSGKSVCCESTEIILWIQNVISEQAMWQRSNISKVKSITSCYNSCFRLSMTAYVRSKLSNFLCVQFHITWVQIENLITMTPNSEGMLRAIIQAQLRYCSFIVSKANASYCCGSL